MTRPGPATQRAPAPVSEGEDQRLVERVRAGDGTALAAIFQAHYAALCGFLVGHLGGRRDAAEELVQDLFLRIWERRAQWVVEGSLRGYLYSAARHRALNVVRHQRIRERWMERAIASGHPTGVGDVFGQADARIRTSELAQTLAAAIAELPPRCREVYVLRTQHDMSHAEIAQAMGISTKAVEFQLTRAFKAVAARVDPLLG